MEESYHTYLYGYCLWFREGNPTPKIAENKAKDFRHDSFALEALAAFS